MTIEQKRKDAMSIYTPPFRYVHGYIYDSNNLMVADDGDMTGEKNVKSAIAARVRGWGKISYMQNGAAIQDEIGQMVVDALNQYYENN
jgi:hypothetical protein